MLGMEYVGGGRVIDDDGILEIASDLGQVLYVVALVVVATLAKQPVMNDVVPVELIEERIAILESGESALHVHRDDGTGTTNF